MSLLLTIREGADRDALIRDLDAAGVPWSEPESLTRVLYVDLDDVERFPRSLAGHPSILSVVDGSATVADLLSLSRTIEIGAGWDGAWHLARHVSRDLPWQTAGVPLPLSIPHTRERTGVGVNIYIIDSGARAAHVEFAGRVTNLYDFNGVTGDPIDEFGHGTPMFSLAAGANLGFATSANLFSCRAFGSNGSTTTARMVASFDAALTHFRAGSNPGVINLSISAVNGVDPYLAAVRDCISAGMVLMAAAGNASRLLEPSYRSFPGVSDRVICVGGIQPDDGPYAYGPSGTNYGFEVDILAAGQLMRIATHLGNDTYRIAHGTSCSTAVATGLVACMLEGYQKPTTGDQVQAFGVYLYEQSTKGKVRHRLDYTPLTDAIAYLDPRPIDLVPPIPGWTRRSV